jgi:hypothetical protein
MKPNAVFSNLIISNGNSNGQSNISLPAPSPVNVNSNESNRAIQNLNSRFAVDETKREKTPADFLRQIIIEQPIGSSTGKSEPLEMKLGKLPQKPTVVDYNRAAWRAIFKKAGYGILTDGEIQQAVGAMRDNKLKTVFDGFNIDNLRRYDAQPGAMFLDADRAAIESAKRAGQAVLQYQEYQAKGTDANQEKAQSEINQMLLDPLRLGGNVPFRWTERILNTPRDILQQIDKGEIMPGSATAKWIGGKISEQITGEPAPEIPTISESVEQLTGAKLPAIPEIEVPRPFEYQTEKYKTDGKTGEDVGATAIDLFLLRRGITDSRINSPQSLKDLGGLPKTVALKVPQGMTEAQFAKFSQTIRESKVSQYGEDIRIHGSRAVGDAKATSDIDVAIRVSPEKFNQILKEAFKKVKVGSGNSAEKTMLYAIKNGKIRRGDLDLSALGNSLAEQFGFKKVDISVIREDSPFDRGPWISVK